MAEGLQIVAAGHVTRLKWHRLRRSLADSKFGLTVMTEGFRLGASMELDLQWEMVVTAARLGFDMVALAHAEGALVDALTHAMARPAKGFSDAEWREFADLLALQPDQITTDHPIATEAAYFERMRA